LKEIVAGAQHRRHDERINAIVRSGHTVNVGVMHSTFCVSSYQRAHSIMLWAALHMDLECRVGSLLENEQNKNFLGPAYHVWRSDLWHVRACFGLLARQVSRQSRGRPASALKNVGVPSAV
jgi:hypothetical protein